MTYISPSTPCFLNPITEYPSGILFFNIDYNVVGIDCTGFVEIVENRLYKNNESIELIKSKLKIAKNNNEKRVILGCTHYPYLEDIFKNIFDIEYFNPASTIAKIVKDDLNNNSQKGGLEFYVSSNPNDFIKNAKMFFDVKEVKLIDI